jgi:hypothetical protein
VHFAKIPQKYVGFASRNSSSSSKHESYVQTGQICSATSPVNPLAVRSRSRRRPFVQTSRWIQRARDVDRSIRVSAGPSSLANCKSLRTRWSPPPSRPLLRDCRNAHSSVLSPPTRPAILRRLPAKVPRRPPTMSVRRRFLSPSPPPRKHREGYAIHKRRHHLSLQHDPRRCSCPVPLPFPPRYSKFSVYSVLSARRCFRWGCSPYLHCLPSERAKADRAENREEKDQYMQQRWRPLHRT